MLSLPFFSSEFFTDDVLFCPGISFSIHILSALSFWWIVSRSYGGGIQFWMLSVKHRWLGWRRILLSASEWFRSKSCPSFVMEKRWYHARIHINLDGGTSGNVLQSIFESKGYAAHDIFHVLQVKGGMQRYSRTLRKSLKCPSCLGLRRRLSQNFFTSPTLHILFCQLIFWFSSFLMMIWEYC